MIYMKVRSDMKKTVEIPYSLLEMMCDACTSIPRHPTVPRIVAQVSVPVSGCSNGR